MAPPDKLLGKLSGFGYGLGIVVLREDQDPHVCCLGATSSSNVCDSHRIPRGIHRVCGPSVCETSSGAGNRVELLTRGRCLSGSNR